jgi:hypothetical protein
VITTVAGPRRVVAEKGTKGFTLSEAAGGYQVMFGGDHLKQVGIEENPDDLVARAVARACRSVSSRDPRRLG